MYRYELRRHLEGTGPRYCFVGVNPSTATDEVDDATVRKWNGFVRRWGGSGYLVVNAFAFRSTDVRGLAEAVDPVGPANNFYIDWAVHEVDVVVPCWGRAGKLPRTLRPRLDETLALLRRSGKPLRCLGYTEDGQPRHPLMLGYDTPLEDMRDG